MSQADLVSVKRARPRLPTKAQIQRLIKAARESGIDVAGFRVESDGAIVIFDKTSTPRDEFERWQESRPN